MDQARQFLTQYSGPEAYAVFYAIIMGCCIGFPFNSDITIIAGVVLATLGFFKIEYLFVLAFCALLSGDTINFFVARKYGKRILAKRPFSFILKPETVTNAEAFFRNKGSNLLFFVRFMPLIRTALFFTAGSLQIRPRTFYFLNVTSTIIYLTALMGASAYASENIDSLLRQFKQIQFLLLGTATALSLFFIFRKKQKRSVES